MLSPIWDIDGGIFMIRQSYKWIGVKILPAPSGKIILTLCVCVKCVGWMLSVSFRSPVHRLSFGPLSFLGNKKNGANGENGRHLPHFHRFLRGNPYT